MAIAGGEGTVLFNEPPASRAERRVAVGGHRLLLDASIARGRKGFDLAIGVGHLFSVDSSGAALCDRDPVGDDCSAGGTGQLAGFLMDNQRCNPHSFRVARDTSRTRSRVNLHSSGP